MKSKIIQTNYLKIFIWGILWCSLRLVARTMYYSVEVMPFEFEAILGRMTSILFCVEGEAKRSKVDSVMRRYDVSGQVATSNYY